MKIESGFTFGAVVRKSVLSRIRTRSTGMKLSYSKMPFQQTPAILDFRDKVGATCYRLSTLPSVSRANGHAIPLLRFRAFHTTLSEL